MTLTAPAPTSTKRPAATPVRVAGPRTRRVPWVALGLILVVAGALVFGTVVQSAGKRTAVVVTARALEPGQVVKASDLAVLDVAVDGKAALVPADRRGELVGKRAASHLPAGSVVGFGHLSAGSGLGPGQVVVGALLGPGGLPVPNLRVGDRVRLLASAGPTSTDIAGEARGNTLGQASVYLVVPGTQAGSQFVSLVVDGAQAQAVSDAAAAQHLRLVLVGGDGRPTR
jgi:hypothetical protein